jgi:hypothetical protein
VVDTRCTGNIVGRGKRRAPDRNISAKSILTMLQGTYLSRSSACFSRATRTMRSKYRRFQLVSAASAVASAAAASLAAGAVTLLETARARFFADSPPATTGGLVEVTALGALLFLGAAGDGVAESMGADAPGAGGNDAATGMAVVAAAAAAAAAVAPDSMARRK